MKTLNFGMILCSRDIIGHFTTLLLQEQKKKKKKNNKIKRIKLPIITV
jgi:hypothetical protein